MKMYHDLLAFSILTSLQAGADHSKGSVFRSMHCVASSWRKPVLVNSLLQELSSYSFQLEKSELFPSISPPEIPELISKAYFVWQAWLSQI